MRKSIILSVTAYTLLFVCTRTQADVPSSKETEERIKENSPPVCIGYYPDRKSWGSLTSWRELTNLCPKNHAFLGIHEPVGPFIGKKVRLSGSCCPLPSSDILTEEHQFADTICPEEHVVTGICIGDDGCKRLGGHTLRCTRISTNYTLSSPRVGSMWGINNSAAFPWKEFKLIREDEVPTALRYGISRVGINTFYNSGCVGSPIGSLLTGKNKSSCRGTYWRQLLSKKNIDGKAVPVKMFPDCRGITDLFSPNAACVK